MLQPILNTKKNMCIIFVFALFEGSLIAATPVHEWLLDEGAGQVVNDSGTAGNDGTLMQGTASGVHGPQWAVDPQQGMVLDFDGDDWILTDSQGILGANPRTVTAMIYLSADSYRHTIIQWGNGSANAQYFRLVTENRRLRLEVAGGNALALNTGDLALNTWYHIALAVDDFNNNGQVKTPEVKFYLNGVEMPQTAGADQFINTTFTDSNCYVRLGGAAPYGGSSTPREAMTGRLSHVRMYNTALSLTEIIEDMGQETAWAPIPANESNVPVSTELLSWLPGSYMQSQHIYFGTDAQDVELATPADPRGVYLDAVQILGPDSNARYSINLDNEGISLAGETPYYWRVDQVNPAYAESPWQGSVWSFTTDQFDASPENLTRSGDLSSLTLSWDPPTDLTSPLYDVLIAEDVAFQQIVSQASALADTSWLADTSSMFFETDYYCKVEAYDPSNPSIRGSSETLLVHFEAPRVIEDFDVYMLDSELLAVWQDGTTNATGSTISLNYDADGQSMNLTYENLSAPYLSIIQRDFASPQNWQAWGTDVFQLSFRASSVDAQAALYVEFEDEDMHTAKIYYDGNLDELVPEVWSPWTAWRIDFNEIQDSGVDVSRMVGLKIGVEHSAQSPAQGEIQINQISVDVARCLPEYTDPADVNQDCVLDMTDLQLLAANWLAVEYSVSAASSEPADYIVYYPMNETSGSTVYDQAGLYNALVQADDPDAVWDSNGYAGGCIDFDGTFGVLLPDGLFDGINSAFTISFWVDFGADENPGIRGIEFASGLQEPTQWDTVLYSYAEPVDGWHHLCMTKDSSTGCGRIYWDGVIAAEGLSADTPINGTTIGTSYLGAAANGAYGFTSSRMDEFRIYGRALTHEEVVFLSKGPAASVTQPLVPIVCPFDPVQDNHINLMDFEKLADVWLAVEID